MPILSSPRGLAALTAAAFLLAAAPAPAQDSRPAARIQPAPAPTQGPDQTELVKRRAEKLAKPVFQNAAWRTDFDAARKEAQDRDTLLLTYFTRSYSP
ncbi:MAG: hypothetical protein AB7O84_14485 [Planctomycetota bacterium]